MELHTRSLGKIDIKNKNESDKKVKAQVNSNDTDKNYRFIAIPCMNSINLAML